MKRIGVTILVAAALAWASCKSVNQYESATGIKSEPGTPDESEDDLYNDLDLDLESIHAEVANVNTREPKATVEQRKKWFSYLAQCESEIGFLPNINEAACSTGHKLEFGMSAGEKKCDYPLKFAGDCEVGSTIKVIKRESHPDVTWVLMCRTGDNNARKFKFRDLIGHNKKTGATCFANFVNSGVTGSLKKLNAATVTYPDNPRDGGQVCTQCHGADPFIVSPAIAKAIDDYNLNWPETMFGKYKVVGQDYAYHQEQDLKDLPHYLDPDEAGACASCHRIGKELCYNNEMLGILGLSLSDSETPQYEQFFDPDRTDVFNRFPRSTSMPPAGHRDSFKKQDGSYYSYKEWLSQTDLGRDQARILECCKQPWRCNWRPVPFE